MLFAGLGSVRMVKNCDLGQHFQDHGHSFSLYGPPTRQITYIFSHVKMSYLRAKAHLVFHSCLYNKHSSFLFRCPYGFVFAFQFN